MKLFEKKVGRKTAEIITFSFSVALIIGIAFFLVYQNNTHNHSNFLNLTSSLKLDKVQKHGEFYILPLKIINNGRTAVKVQIHVDLGEGELPRERVIDLDYLDKEGDQTIYLTLKNLPEAEKIKVTPLYYFFD